MQARIAWHDLKGSPLLSVTTWREWAGENGALP